MGVLSSTKRILDSPFLQDVQTAYLLKKQKRAPYIPDPVIDISKVKEGDISFTRDHKIINKNDNNQIWEPFDLLIKANIEAL